LASVGGTHARKEQHRALDGHEAVTVHVGSQAAVLFG
jgi:hypothetical protein